MKNLLIIFMISLFTLPTFATQISPDFDVGKDKVKAFVDMAGQKEMIAQINIVSLEVEAFSADYKISTYKIVNDVGGYFVPIKIKNQDCEYIYCTDLKRNEELIYIDKSIKKNKPFSLFERKGVGKFV